MENTQSTEQNTAQQQATQDLRTPREALSLDLLNVIASTEMRQEYAQEIVERERYNNSWRLATAFAQSGVFADLKGQNEREGIARAMAKIELGRGWGLNPADSIRHIYFVQGKPALENEIIASKLKQAGYSWHVEWEGPKENCTGCTLWPSFKGVEMTDKDGKAVSIRFGKSESDRIRVKEDGNWITMSDKAMYKSGYAADMYFWKCIARLKRRYAPDVLTGALTSEEAEEIGSRYQDPRPDAPSAAPVEETESTSNTATTSAQTQQAAAPLPQPEAKPVPPAVPPPPEGPQIFSGVIAQIRTSATVQGVAFFKLEGRPEVFGAPTPLPAKEGDPVGFKAIVKDRYLHVTELWLERTKQEEAPVPSLASLFDN